jgi:hypothetical protein
VDGLRGFDVGSGHPEKMAATPSKATSNVHCLYVPKNSPAQTITMTMTKPAMTHRVSLRSRLFTAYLDMSALPAT